MTLNNQLPYCSRHFLTWRGCWLERASRLRRARANASEGWEVVCFNAFWHPPWSGDFNAFYSTKLALC
jgi:hypothetical protein